MEGDARIKIPDAVSSGIGYQGLARPLVLPMDVAVVVEDGQGVFVQNIDVVLGVEWPGDNADDLVCGRSELDDR